MKRIVLETCSTDQVVIWEHRTIMKDAATLLSINLHHAAVKNTHPKLQHNAPKLLMRICSRASYEWQVVSMVVLKPARGK
jgi:hypothetical protein